MQMSSGKKKQKQKQWKSVKPSVKLLYQDKTCADFREIGDLLYSAESCLEKVLRKRVTHLHIHVLKAYF